MVWDLGEVSANGASASWSSVNVVSVPGSSQGQSWPHKIGTCLDQSPEPQVALDCSSQPVSFAEPIGDQERFSSLYETDSQSNVALGHKISNLKTKTVRTDLWPGDDLADHQHPPELFSAWITENVKPIL